MKINTHSLISERLCGKPVDIKKDEATVELELINEMTADDSGLVHGGFIFGLADYAAMLAVNHPNVVLGSAESKFLKPAVKGKKAIAKAKIESTVGKKNIVAVSVYVDELAVFEAKMTCFVPEKHVLS